MTATHTCAPLPSARPLAWPAAEPFAIGAHLVTPRRGYSHHGIYVGHGRVVHYAGWSRAVLSARPVEEVSLEQFAGDHGVFALAHSPASFAPDEVVARARSRLGENSYRITTNNCVHFCHWCRSGEARSDQVERLLGFVAAMFSPRGMTLVH